jgi:hypothetical protein
LVFVVTSEPPVVWLTIVIGVSGVVEWVLPPILHKMFVHRSAAKPTPLIEAKRDEIDEVCEKWNKLLKG